MTNDELVPKIQSRGYWRINFRPTSPEDTLGSVSKAKRLVEQCTVSLRGWDFPHMPHGADGDRTALLEDCFEASTDWGDKHEFWRIYSSSQFIHLKSIRTDWLAEDTFHGDRSAEFPPYVLGLVDNVWHVAEAFEFLSRMSEAGLYRHGAAITVGLMNTAGRSLHVDDFKRGGLHWDRTTSAPKIVYEDDLSTSEIAEPKARTKEAIRFILDRFDFEPEDQVLTSIIDELYGLNIGRG